MKLLGCEPVDDDVIKVLQKRKNLTLRQIAEIRLHEILKNLKYELREKNSHIQRLEMTNQHFKKEISTKQPVNVTNLQNQISKMKIQISDYENQLTELNDHRLNSKRFSTELEEKSSQISILSNDLESTKSKYSITLDEKIKLEKELAVTKSELSVLKTDNNYLKSDKIDNSAKNKSLEYDLQNQWKNLEKLKFELVQIRQEKSVAEAKVIEKSARIESLENEASKLRKELEFQGQTGREITMKAQHDTDLTHEKLKNMQKVNSDLEIEISKLQQNLFDFKNLAESSKVVYEKDVKILEQQLLDSERDKEASKTDKLKYVSNVGGISKKHLNYSINFF